MALRPVLRMVLGWWMVLRKLNNLSSIFFAGNGVPAQTISRSNRSKSLRVEKSKSRRVYVKKHTSSSYSSSYSSSERSDNKKRVKESKSRKVEKFLSFKAIKVESVARFYS
jgi:hypothetical protein